jgi:hypothetical protein
MEEALRSVDQLERSSPVKSRETRHLEERAMRMGKMVRVVVFLIRLWSCGMKDEPTVPAPTES